MLSFSISGVREFSGGACFRHTEQLWLLVVVQMQCGMQDRWTRVKIFNV